MRTSESPDFGNLDLDQLFRFQGSLYRKQDQRTAVLIRDEKDEPVTNLKTHTFYPEDTVEVVTEET